MTRQRFIRVIVGLLLSLGAGLLPLGAWGRTYSGLGRLVGNEVLWWVAVVIILLYVAFFALGMGPGPWLIISEIFPTKVRGRAASIATSTLWSGTLLVTFTFLSLVKTLNLWGTFAIYGALSFVCLIFVWKMVPETKGRTLEQIQQTWSK